MVRLLCDHRVCRRLELRDLPSWSYRGMRTGHCRLVARQVEPFHEKLNFAKVFLNRTEIPASVPFQQATPVHAFINRQANDFSMPEKRIYFNRLIPVKSNLPMDTFEQIAERERQFLLQTYSRYPVVLTRGKGVFLYDIDGKRYLDFVSGLGVNALGHAHPRIVKAIREQAAKLIHVSNLYYNQYQGPLAEKLCTLSGLNRAFFSNSGTEAIEGSIKLARLAGHRAGGESKSRLVALEGSYHGRTFGALSLTGQDKHRKGFEPLLEDVTFVKQNDLEGLRAAVNDNTCAIVLEPIFGEGGIFECSVEFLRECRVLADRHQVALIFDEIQCGLGRTGTIFAFQSFGVTPDIVAIAKPIAAGLPLGAFIAKEEFATAISPGQHGTTFGGGPLACRVALEFLAIVEEEKLLDNVNKVGAYLQQELKTIVEKS